MKTPNSSNSYRTSNVLVIIQAQHTMAFLLVKIFLVAAVTGSCLVNAGNIQLEPTQGILIPGPIAQTLLRTSRSAYGGPSPSYSAPAAAPAPSYSAPAAAPAPSYSAPAPAPAYSAPAPAPQYSAPASIPAPQCPRNYLFSCAPNLAPVPCSAGGYGAAASSGGYSVGSATPAHLMGAYSEFVPQYAVPIVQEVY